MNGLELLNYLQGMSEQQLKQLTVQRDECKVGKKFSFVAVDLGKMSKLWAFNMYVERDMRVVEQYRQLKNARN